MNCFAECLVSVVLAVAQIGSDSVYQNTSIYNETVEIVVEESTSEPFFYEYEGNKSESCTYISVDSSKPILLVGDSRTVGFHIGTKCDEFSYVAKGSMGYTWLTEGTSKYKPVELIESYIESNPDVTVILNLGVNDPGNKEKYAEWVTQFVEKHPDVDFCYLSVNPASRGDNLDDKVTEFNTYVKNNIPKTVRWLDSNSYLKEIGFSSWDGVHYNPSTYKDILEFIQSSFSEPKESYKMIKIVM